LNGDKSDKQVQVAFIYTWCCTAFVHRQDPGVRGSANGLIVLTKDLGMLPIAVNEVHQMKGYKRDKKYLNESLSF